MVRRSKLLDSTCPQKPVLIIAEDVRSIESVRRAQGIPFLLCALFIAIVLLGLTAQQAWAQDQSQSMPTPPPFDPAAIPTPQGMPLSVLAESSYAENCAPCHGETGNSDGPTVTDLPAPPPKFSDPATIVGKSPAEYFHIVKYGRIQNLMPPWGNRLSDEEIWQVVYYAWSLHSSSTAAQQGRELYNQECSVCHGDQGQGDGPQAPVDLSDFSNSAAMIVKTQADLDEGWRKAHADLGASWSADQRQAVLDTVRSFSYVEPWNRTLPPGDGSLTGTVRQGTADGDVITTTEVGLTGYVNFEPLITQTVVSDAQGLFTFTQLSLVDRIQYVVDTTYKGLKYTAFAPPLSAITPTADVAMMVYETTDADSSIQMPRLSLVVDFEPGALLLGEISDIFNAGDRTFTGKPVTGLDKPATLVVPLLSGATDIHFQDGELGGRYQQVGNVVYDVIALPPGERVNFVSYRLPISQSVQTLQPQFAYPVDQINILVANLPDLKVDVPGLTKNSVEQIQGREYQIWIGTMPPAGLQVQIEGALVTGSTDPRAATESNEAATSSEITESTVNSSIALSLAGVLAVLLAGVLIYPLWGRAGNSHESLKSEKEELIRHIAELDDLHAIEQIATSVWQQQRAQLKSRLLDVTQELNSHQPKVKT